MCNEIVNSTSEKLIDLALAPENDENVSEIMKKSETLKKEFETQKVNAEFKFNVQTLMIPKGNNDYFNNLDSNVTKKYSDIEMKLLEKLKEMKNIIFTEQVAVLTQEPILLRN
jgi:hypothetical protein